MASEFIEGSAKPAVIESGDRLDSLARRIDDIAAFQKWKAPWYRDTSTIISAAAFLISIVTTLASWHRSYQQDIIATRGQLSAILQQAGSLQRANVEYFDKFKDNSQAMATMSVILNQENVQLANEAYSLARSLGTNASVTQLMNAAYYLMLSDLTQPGKELLATALTRSENSIEYVAALRMQGALHYKLGNLPAGRDAFLQATKAFDKFPQERNDSYENVTQAYTHYYWAAAALPYDCGEARGQMELATQFWNKVPGVMKQQNLPSNTVNCPN